MLPPQYDAAVPPPQIANQIDNVPGSEGEIYRHQRVQVGNEGWGAPLEQSVNAVLGYNVNQL